MTWLLRLLPAWAPWAVAAGALFVAGICYAGMQRADRRTAEARADRADDLREIATAGRKALEAEIAAHNATAKKLEAQDAKDHAHRAEIQAHAASAAVAGAAADRAERRLRDAAATTALAAHAAARDPAAPPECHASAEAAGVLADVLGRLNAAAGAVERRARIVDRFADDAEASAAQCSERYETVRAGQPP